MTLLGGVFLFCFKFIYFIYFWLHWVFIAARGLSLVAASGGYSSLRCAGFSLWWLLLLRSTDSRRTGFSSCGTRVWLLCGMWYLPDQGLNPCPCIGRRILNHCATREALGGLLRGHLYLLPLCLGQCQLMFVEVSCFGQ